MKEGKLQWEQAFGMCSRIGRKMKYESEDA